jgi:hypothetical protein
MFDRWARFVVSRAEQARSAAIVVVKRSDGSPLTAADQTRVGTLATAIAHRPVRVRMIHGSVPGLPC